MQELLTTFEGRIRRRDWWKGTLIIIVIAVVLSIVLSLIFGTTSFFARLVQFIFGLVLLYPVLALGSKRLHDRGKPLLPWMAIFVGPGFLLNLMQVFGLGFSAAVVMGEPVMVPNTLGMIVSFVAMVTGIWGLVELGFLKGTVGENAYGSDPTA
ncbi:MAG: DUF805 domain-containing protein [Rubellimicrobium sp.]|nr:DUF805 domain-containing protein [Rubellimicrobium sp.]